MTPLVTNALGALRAFLPSMTRYGAACGTCGDAAGFLAPFLRQDPSMAFALGFLLPVGPLVWYLSSSRRVRAELALWEQWHKERAITQEEARRLRRVTIDALIRRWYGSAADPTDDRPDPPDRGGPDAGAG